ncbi:MAG: hypothetical protein QOJ68_3379 [Blastococcus sp.]|nr:hypothetical protein [Blastococcus sp.]
MRALEDPVAVPAVLVFRCLRWWEPWRGWAGPASALPASSGCKPPQRCAEHRNRRWTASESRQVIRRVWPPCQHDSGVTKLPVAGVRGGTSARRGGQSPTVHRGAVEGRAVDSCHHAGGVLAKTGTAVGEEPGLPQTAVALAFVVYGPTSGSGSPGRFPAMALVRPESLRTPGRAAPAEPAHKREVRTG